MLRVGQSHFQVKATEHGRPALTTMYGLVAELNSHLAWYGSLLELSSGEGAARALSFDLSKVSAVTLEGDPRQVWGGLGHEQQLRGGPNVDVDVWCLVVLSARRCVVRVAGLPTSQGACFGHRDKLLLLPQKRSF